MDFILSLLRDQLWGFVGAFFGLVSIPVAFWIFLVQRKFKELSFGVLSTRRLFSVDPQVASRIEVLFDGKQIGELHLIVLGLKNSGTEPILATDFTQSITFDVNSGTKILSAEITKQSPRNLGFDLQFSEYAIQLKSVLLNAGDYAVLQAVLSGSQPTMTPNFRVIGVAEPKLLQTNPLRIAKTWTPWQRAGHLLFWLGGNAVIVFAMIDVIKTYTQITPVLFGGLLSVLLFAIVITLLRERYSRKFRRYIEDA